MENNKIKKSKKKFVILLGVIISIIMFAVGTATQKGDKVDDIYVTGLGVGFIIILIGCCMKSQKKLDEMATATNKTVSTEKKVNNTVGAKLDVIKNKQYNFKSIQSGSASIIINDDKITIKRKGLLAVNAHGLTGEKTFRINQISAVQLKEAKMAIGYIQFVLIGSQESKGGLQAAMRDENTVCFDGGFNAEKTNQEAREIKDYIENYISNMEKNKNVIVSQNDKYDQLAKLKKLLDDNVITQEEFESEKSKLLQ